MAEFERVARSDELATGERKVVVVDDTPVLLLRTDDGFHAIEDVCTHDGQPLKDGPLDGHTITCPRHGAQFDLKTGRAVCMPATESVTTFEVQVVGDDVLVRPQS
ncbi:MAG: non-heme iron oxygenase ferredoxin subunit [Planctomycetaceae bacterium]